MAKRTGRSAWVVRWEWWGEHRRPPELILQFLPYRWPSQRVSRYLQTVYLNSHETDPTSRIYFLNRGASDEAWQRKIRDAWPRVSVGHDPILLAVYVQDLDVSRVSLAEIRVEFTDPPFLAPGKMMRQFESRPGKKRNFVIDTGKETGSKWIITEQLPTPTA